MQRSTTDSSKPAPPTARDSRLDELLSLGLLLIAAALVFCWLVSPPRLFRLACGQPDGAYGLIVAASNNDIAGVRRALHAGIDADDRCGDGGVTALMMTDDPAIAR